MSDPWEALAAESFSIVKDSLKGFVERAEVDVFIKEKTDAYAREWWGSVNAATEEVRKEHADNLKHLAAQVRGEARKLQIALAEEVKDTIGRILEAVGGFLLRAAPKLLVLL
jgi:hypothetical protein